MKFNGKTMTAYGEFENNSLIDFHIEDKNNPHGVTAAQVGAMERGVMSYYHPSDTDETNLNTWLENTVLPTMPDNTCKNVSICCGAIDSMVLAGVAYKNTNSWVIVDVVSHVNGHHYTKTKNGDWKNTVCNDSVFTNGAMEATVSYFPNPKACKFFIVNVRVDAYFSRYHSFAVDTHTLKDGENRYFDFEFPMLNPMDGATMGIYGCRLTARKREAQKDVAFVLENVGAFGSAYMTRIVGYC